MISAPHQRIPCGPFVAIGLSLTVLFGVASPSYSAESSPRKVIYVEESMPTSMNPLFPGSDADRRAHQLVFDYLYERSVVAEGHRSRIIDSITQNETKPTYNLHLKKGIRWHDKQPLTATDICFTIRALQHQDTPTSWPVPATIRTCEVIEPLTASITFEKPIIELPAHLNFPLIPAHRFDSPAIAKDNPFATLPIGSGPMQATLDERNNWQLTAHKSPHVQTAIEQLTLEHGGDVFAQTQLLLAGAIDGMIRVPPSFIDDVAENPSLALQQNPTTEWWFIAMNTGTASLADAKVRHAIDRLLDRRRLRIDGLGEPEDAPSTSVHWMTGPFLPNSEYANQSLYPILSASHDQAERLFKQAGFARLPNDGALVNGTQPLRLDIGIVDAVEQLAPDFIAELARQLRAGGLEPHFHTIDSNQWKSPSSAGLHANLDMVVGTTDRTGILGVESLFHSTGELNFFRYSNPAADRLIEGLKLDPSSMEAHFAAWELHTLLAQERPFLFLWQLESWSAWSTRINPVIITPETYFADFESWGITP